MATKKTTKKAATPATSSAGKTRVEFTVRAEKHQAIAKAQRDFIGSMADRVEKGEPFERAAERTLIAGILRAWARQIPDTLPNTRDGAARIDPAYAAIHFACLVNGQGRSKSAATDELAQLYEVSPEVIAEAIAKFEAPAMRLVPKKAAPAK
jgi:hypothetical protein